MRALIIEKRVQNLNRLTTRKEDLHQNLVFAKLKPDPPHTALYNTEMTSSAACIRHKYTHRDFAVDDQ